jgi:hypothetical protein
MTPADAPRFKQTLAAVYSLYGKDLTASVLDIWFGALKGYDIAAISEALSRHAVNPDGGQFLPKPADVVRLIDGGGQDAALVAWAKVDKALRSVGPYATVVFDDPLIHFALANLGGWAGLGTKTEEEWPFLRNNFVALYRGARGRSYAYPAKLVGLAESHNSGKGLTVAPTKLIGDPARAQAVLKGGQQGALEVRSVAEIKLLDQMKGGNP